MILEFFLFCLLGIISGLFFGMLGIGGGIFVVPCLAMIFSLMGFDKFLIIKVAIATSLGIMIFTAISSIWAHLKRSNIRFDILKNSILGIFFGTISGTLFAHYINL